MEFGGSRWSLGVKDAVDSAGQVFLHAGGPFGVSQMLAAADASIGYKAVPPSNPHDRSLELETRACSGQKHFLNTL